MKQNNKWNELTMQQRADLMKLYVANGYTNLDSIRKHYNTFNEGGPAETQTEEKSGWQKAKEVAYDVLEFVDPTGVSSYATSEGDLRQAIEGYKKGTASLGDIGIEAVGALPLIGKLGKGIKLAKGVDKLNYFVKAVDRANKVAKRIDTFQEAIPGVRKVATAVQGKTGAITNHLANLIDLSTDSRRYINYGIDAFNNLNTGKDIVDIFKPNPYNYPISRSNYVEKQPILVRSENINIPNLRQGQIDTINTVYNHFIDRGLSPRNAAAIMGSIMQESSFNPYVIQGNGDNAKGLFQMHGERLKDYQKYLEENNLKDDMIPQLNYMVDLINGKRGDYYIEGLNSLNSRIDALQSKSKRTRYEDRELNEKLAYREKIYGERIKNNTLYPIADLTNALSNKDYDLNYITDLFTNTIERPGKPHYENRRAYAKAFLEHFYGIPENEANKYDDGGPIDNDLYYSNIDPVEVTTAKRKVNIPEDPLSKEGRKQAQFYLNRIKSGDMTFEGVPESYKKVVNNYITGDKLVYKGRENSQYKGLNQMMQNLILGGPAGLVLDTAFKGIGSIYNGYNVFDPEHPGLFTKEYSDKHPYLTTAVNMAAALPFGAWDTYMASNMDDFNDLSSVNRRSPGGNRPTKKQARQQINNLENSMEDLKAEEKHVQSDGFVRMLKDQIAMRDYGMSYSQLSDHIRKYIDSMHKTMQKVRTRYSIQSMPVMHTYKRENLPIYKVLANHEGVTDQPKNVYALLGTSYIKDDIGNLQVYKDSNGITHVSSNGMSEAIPTGLTVTDLESGITIPNTLLTRAGKNTSSGIVTKKGKNYKFIPDNITEYPNNNYVNLPQKALDNISSRKAETINAIDRGEGLLPEGSFKVYGSSELSSKNYLPHLSDDVDLIMTVDQANKLKAIHNTGTRMAPDGFKLFTGNKKLDGSKGIDITYIDKDPNTGLAKGEIARQLFYKEFPEEYWEQARKEALGLGEFQITKTPDELLEAFDSTVDTMLDVFTGKNEKFKTRVPVLMEQADVKDLQSTLSRKGRMFFGERYKPIMRNLDSETPLVNTSNVEDNLAALEAMGYTGVNLNKLASDPQRMQLVMEDFYQTMTGLGRGVSDVKGDDVFNSLSQHRQGGGNARGAGLNNVLLGNSGYGDTYGLNQIDLSSYMKGKSASQVVNFFNTLTDLNTKLPKTIIDKINSVLPEKLKISDNATTGEFNFTMSRVYEQSKEIFDAVQEAISKQKDFPIPYVGTENINKHDSFIGSIIPLDRKDKLNVFIQNSKTAYNSKDLDDLYLRASRNRTTEGLASTRITHSSIDKATIWRTKNKLRGEELRRNEYVDYLDRKTSKAEDLLMEKVDTENNKEYNIRKEVSDIITDKRRALHSKYKNLKTKKEYLEEYVIDKEYLESSITEPLKVIMGLIASTGGGGLLMKSLLEDKIKPSSQYLEWERKQKERESLNTKYQEDNKKKYYK